MVNAPVSMRAATLALAAALVASCASSGTGVVAAPTESLASTAASAPAARSAAPTSTPAPRYDELPVAASDPDGIALQLTTIDAAVHDPTTPPRQLAWMGHLQQLALSRLVDYPEWQPAVLAALPDTARAAAKGSLDAGKQLRLIPAPVPRTLPDWRILEPAPIDVLLSYYREAETQFGVPWYYLASIHLVETRMGRIHGLSTSGAQGPMQFMPATWAQYGRGDVNSDHDAILAAARYLAAAGAPGDMQRALFAYNHAQGYVNALVLYAGVMKADPAAYRAYHGWEVYYPTPEGPVYLPVGWVKP